MAPTSTAFWWFSHRSSGIQGLHSGSMNPSTILRYFMALQTSRIWKNNEEPSRLGLDIPSYGMKIIEHIQKPFLYIDPNRYNTYIPTLETVPLSIWGPLLKADKTSLVHGLTAVEPLRIAKPGRRRSFLPGGSGTSGPSLHSRGR